MPSLRELRAKLRPHFTGEGRLTTALPGLWLYRLTTPQPPKWADARMVTLAVILQGRKRVEFGDLKLAYDPGSYLFVLGERRYQASIETASLEHPYMSLSLEIEPERIGEAVWALADAGARFTDDEPDEAAVVARLSRPIVDAIFRLVETLDDPIGRAVLAPLIKKELILHLLRSPSGATLRRAAAMDDGRIRRALKYLQSNVSERVTVEGVARHVGMSPSHFAHRFREVVRMSPIRYVKHLRLQQARMLMLGRGLGAAEAAAVVGYASASHFTRDFKSSFGAPPAAYVQQFRSAL